ncbi:PAS domain S-box protein [Methylophilus methylotrophus]|uniref:PAS domain S-box protein n=1 Tax=Methylophilus methylotrophus TaxID=17 RepID=UPI0009D9B26F|nr:PAS domain S-box protein [Methylophilus methylotrophus]
MKKPEIAPNEIQRLSALHRYQMMDTSAEEVFDNFTYLASQICETPIALITLLDEKRQGFKSKIGIDATEMAREISFCGHAILQEELFEIPNALEDARFHDNPLVTGNLHLRFYAGMPLITHDGYGLGTLCVIDKVPRKLTEEQRAALKILAKQVVSQIESRLHKLELVTLNEKLSERTAFFNSIISSVDQSIISTDVEGRITSFNVGAETMLGYHSAEVVGKTLEIFHNPEEVANYATELGIAVSENTPPGLEVFTFNARKGSSDTRKWSYIRKDGSHVPVQLTITTMHNNSGAVIGFLYVATDIAASEQAKASLASMADLLQRTGEMAKIGGWEFDLVTKQLQWSKEIFAMHEIDSDEIPPLEEAIHFYAPEAVPVMTEAISKALEEGTSWDLELPFITAKDRHIWVRTQGTVVTNQDKPVRLIGAFQDITERKKNELDLAWVNRALQMLGKCNELLIHIKNETVLITEICRIAVVIGGYRMAWVGYAENDEYKSIMPQAHFGQSSVFLNTIRLSWSEHERNGLGPGGKTIRTGQTVVVDDLLLDDSYPAKKEALAQGYRSLVSLPLKNKEKTFGLLALYREDAHRFAQDELRLLQDLADNLAAGIINIRAESERQQLQNAMLKVATAVSVSSGETFFSQLVTNMVSALGAQAGYASRFLSEKPLIAETIAAVVDEKIISNFDYSISDALAEELFNSSDLRIVAEHADRDFPHISMMKFAPYQAFAGLCIYNASGNAVGLLFVFFRDPILQKSHVLIESTLKIFAARIASELDRQASATAVIENAKFIKTITDAMPAMVAYWDRSLICRFANKPYIQWFGKSTDDIIGTSKQALLGQSLFKADEPYIRGALAGECQQFERTLTKADGSLSFTWTNYIPDIDAHGTVNGFYVLVTDVTPIIKAENQLKLATSVFQNTIEGIMVTDIDSVILSVNPAFSAISGYSAEEVLGHTPRIFNSGYHPKAFFDDMQAHLKESRVWKGEIWNRRKNGEIYPANMTITAVADSNDEVTNYVGIFSDNTEYKMHEEQRLADESNQRDALVREVHHRIKNNLQSVASLLSNFSTQHPQLAEPLNTAITQVKSIAAVHGLQGQFVNSAVGLRGLIEAISNNNQLLWNTQIVLSMPADAPVILVEEKESVPLALVMNELITNAIKHGDQSQIAIELAYDADGNKVSIVIRNKGKLAETSTNMTPHFGTGLQLATVLLPKKNASLSWEQAGEFVITRIDLTAPIIAIGSRSN